MRFWGELEEPHGSPERRRAAGCAAEAGGAEGPTSVVPGVQELPRLGSQRAQEGAVGQAGAPGAGIAPLPGAGAPGSVPHAEGDRREPGPGRGARRAAAAVPQFERGVRLQRARPVPARQGVPEPGGAGSLPQPGSRGPGAPRGQPDDECEGAQPAGMPQGD